MVTAAAAQENIFWAFFALEAFEKALAGARPPAPADLR
jgi:hypothetical protein